MTEGDHVLAFEGVTSSFGDERVLEDVSFRIEDGERVALVGASGAGKTTLLRLANGSLRADEGRVTFDGHRATSEDVTLAYQGETLVDRRSALANVVSGRLGDLPWWRGLVEPLSPREPDPAMALLEAVRLADRAGERVDRLSAGERQRVAFARALVRDAPAVLADEPTANLDPASRESVLDVLDAVTGDRMLLTVLHDVDLALDHYDRIVGLADGRLQFDAPASAVTDEMLAAVFASEGATNGEAGDNEVTAESGTDSSPSTTTEGVSHSRGVPWDD